MLLTGKFVERARAHAIGKRAGAIVWIFSARDGLKEAHVSNLRFPIFELPSVVAVPGHLVGFSLQFSANGLAILNHYLCFDISYSTMLAAIPAFSDSTLEECGMTTTSSISDIRSRGSPPPSLPMKMASWPVSFALERVMPLCDEVAISRRSCVRIAPSIASSFVRAMGTRNTDPADARTSLELKGLTVPSPSSTPAAPKASAERRIVPRLPGSCTPAIASSGPACALAITSSGECSFQRTRAATPCGVSLGTTLANSLSGRSRVSTFAPIWGSSLAALFCAELLKNTARKRSPLRMASSRMRTPSMAQYPSGVALRGRRLDAIPLREGCACLRWGEGGGAAAPFGFDSQAGLWPERTPILRQTTVRY